MKEIKLSPETATVKAEWDESYSGECKEQLVMEEQGLAKCWITAQVKTTWVEIHFNEKVYSVQEVGFVSAFDHPFRDPKKITISYFDQEEGAFKESVVVRPEFSKSDRHELKKFKIPACKTKAFKFDMSLEPSSNMI